MKLTKYMCKWGENGTSSENCDTWNRRTGRDGGIMLPVREFLQNTQMQSGKDMGAEGQRRVPFVSSKTPTAHTVGVLLFRWQLFMPLPRQSIIYWAHLQSEAGPPANLQWKMPKNLYLFHILSSLSVPPEDILLLWQHISGGRARAFYNKRSR